MWKRAIKTVDAWRQAFFFSIFGPRTVSWIDRVKIVHRILQARRQNKNGLAASFGEQILLVNAILRIPPHLPGVIAEFGCFKGLSTVALSIAAKYVNRRVVVFDSFEGLPEPQEAVQQLATGKVIDYQKGSFCGTLEEVRSVVARYGEIDQIEFVEGYFCDTQPKRPADEKHVMIFEDADLVESVRDVLRYAWPKLQLDAWFFCHEAKDLEVVKLFFDDAVWLQMHGQKAPGLYGVGLGLPIDVKNWGTAGLHGMLGSCLAGLIKRA